ncbi:DUF551 domain-containing protein [bacterium]|nr:DUF551 domain-containing protein [bacterium]MBD5401159.1 DUF551 domain-containing protein [bacterium]
MIIVYQYEVGDEVTHWMPIPEPPKTESE